MTSTASRGDLRSTNAAMWSRRGCEFQGGRLGRNCLLGRIGSDKTTAVSILSTAPRGAGKACVWGVGVHIVPIRQTYCSDPHRLEVDAFRA